MTTHAHPTIPGRAAPMIVRTYPPSRAYSAVADLRSRGAALTDPGPTLALFGPMNDARDEPTPSGAAYIARLDRIMRIS